MSIIYKEESYKILGACFQVYNELGPGFLEAVYQECLALEFVRQSIPFTQQEILQLTYKRKIINQKYVADFYCYKKIILEIKASKEIHKIHAAQVINYLKATSCKLGILVNFGNPEKLEYIRLVN